MYASNMSHVLTTSPVPAPFPPHAAQPASASQPQFLGDVGHLVDMDNLLAGVGSVGAPVLGGAAANPFLSASGGASGGAPKSSSTNPFLQDKPKPQSINQMRNQQSASFAQTAGPTGAAADMMLLQSPLMPTNAGAGSTAASGTNDTSNPFF